MQFTGQVVSKEICTK